MKIKNEKRSLGFLIVIVEKQLLKDEAEKKEGEER